MKQLYLLEFDNNIYSKTYDNNNNSIIKTTNITVKDLFYDIRNIRDKPNYVDNLDNLDNLDNIYVVVNGINVSINETLENIQNITIPNKTHRLDETPIIKIHFYRKMRGGDPLDDILDVIFSFLDPIIKPIMMIGNIFMFLIKMVIWLVKFIIWTFRFLWWVLLDLLNPVTFLADFFNSFMIIIYAIFNTIFTLFISLVSLCINTIGGWMQGFWGWDMSGLTKNDRNSVYFRSFDRTKGRKSYITNSNNVPFSIILGTILCPPMGVFMDLGITGWFNMLICTLLTLLFYLPGLCYALIIIYG